MTFRKMRRFKQELSQEECISILKTQTSGVLGVIGDEGYPYTVPLSYVYDQGVLYFHCAKTGHKLDAIKNNPKVSFCVIAKDQVVPEEYTSYFRSVILFGKATIIEDDHEKREAIEKLAMRYHPNDHQENRDYFINKEYSLVTMVKITIEHMTGKAAIELMKN